MDYRDHVLNRDDHLEEVDRRGAGGSFDALAVFSSCLVLLEGEHHRVLHLHCQL